MAGRGIRTDSDIGPAPRPTEGLREAPPRRRAAGRAPANNGSREAGRGGVRREAAEHPETRIPRRQENVSTYLRGAAGAEGAAPRHRGRGLPAGRAFAEALSSGWRTPRPGREGALGEALRRTSRPGRGPFHGGPSVPFSAVAARRPGRGPGARAAVRPAVRLSSLLPISAAPDAFDAAGSASGGAAGICGHACAGSRGVRRGDAAGSDRPVSARRRSRPLSSATRPLVLPPFPPPPARHGPVRSGPVRSWAPRPVSARRRRPRLSRGTRAAGGAGGGREGGREEEWPGRGGGGGGCEGRGRECGGRRTSLPLSLSLLHCLPPSLSLLLSMPIALSMSVDSIRESIL